ncbi:MAG: 5-(carboxyamino)imidazole ribonucleotide mutase [Planctomycetota bacterium]|nr:MAG: 5-(carboxyamino)imidazole ribonucleotide mutase [Planctomycetota bacterium]
MTARVALLMGSDSDFERLKPAVQIFQDFGVAVEVRVLSAHRTPDEVVRFVTEAPERGIRVFLCAAGGAAHLAGVVTAHTTLPVLGIPLDNPPLGGLDALLSTVQMPGGVPVATFGVGRGGPDNAALFALRILALADPALAAQLERFRGDQRDKVRKRDAALQDALRARPA